MSTNDREWTVADLHSAAQVGDYETVNMCLDADVDIDATLGQVKNTALHVAADCGNSDIVEFLVSLGANIEATDKHGQTPLHLAALAGNDDIVEQLVMAGSDLDAKDRNGWTPLHEAASSGQASVVELLMDGGADAMLTNDLGETAAHHAAKSGNLDVLMTLADHASASLGLGNKMGATCAHLAARQDQADVLTYLADLGHNLDAKDKDGATPLHYAAVASGDKAVKFLVENGSNLNAQDRFGETPLHMAARMDNQVDQKTEICRHLIQHGADPSIAGMNGKTAIDVAANEQVRGVMQSEVQVRVLQSMTAGLGWSPDPKEVDAQFERRYAEASQGQGMEPQRQQASARMRL